MQPTLHTALARQAEQAGGLFGLELPPFTEFALVAVRRSRIEQLVAEGSRPARAVRGALEQLDTYIAATQFGITMASLALGWIGETALAHLIDTVLAWLLPAEWVQAGSHAISFAISAMIACAD